MNPSECDERRAFDKVPKCRLIATDFPVFVLKKMSSADIADARFVALVFVTLHHCRARSIDEKSIDEI